MYLDLTKQIVDVTNGLSELFETSIPEFLKSREKAQSVDYNNMLTAATFFSAVTATTLQLSYAYNSSTQESLGVAVNTLWFVALVFSTASSLNSLVGLMWYQKIRQNRLLPSWVKLWVEYGPTISLVVASAAFSAGLCLFAFSSSQHTITSALTATFTVVHAVALFVPLCLYSPDYSLPVYWYLHNVPRQDRARVVRIIRRRGAPWSKVNYICFAYGIAQTDTLSTRVKKNIKKAWTSVRSSAHSVVVWLTTTRRSDRLVGRRNRIRPTEEPSDTEQEQTHGTGINSVELGELERGNGFHEDSGEPEMQIRTVTEGQGIAPSEEPQTSTRDNTDPIEGATQTAKGSGTEVEHDLDTRATPESSKEPTATTSSTAGPTPGPGLTPMVSNSDNGLENAERQETGAPARPNTSQEDEPEHPFDSSVQEGVEAYNIGASSSAFEIERRREGTGKNDRPSADVGSPDNFK
ncbi:hypothetical protein M0805_001962 [Coniferiporia weirii]|nr:hypothetical protein M0805_001962 [Coniferiporia weirii]